MATKTKGKPKQVQDQLPAKDIVITSTFMHILTAWQGGKRRIFLEGGTTSSKTYSAIQFLVLMLSSSQVPMLATVTSESLPHLKRGCIRDFINIMGDDLDERRWNRSDNLYEWPNGCQIEFVSGDQPGKFSGPRRHVFFCNELNNLHRDVYREGDLRTSRFTIADWNPYGEFWFHDEKVADETGNVYIGGLTYHDTPEIISQSTIRTIESYKDKDPNYYRVHALGMMGKIEGLVHPKFDQCDILPDGFCFYGIDYGFTTDPTAIVKNVIVGDNLYSQELVYERGLTNDDISQKLMLFGVGKSPIYPDPNERKSAEELRKKGFNVVDLDKAFARMTFRIQRVNQYNQYWTKDSLNAIKEQRNYRYLEDRTHAGQFKEDTTHQWSHCMSARQFAIAGLKPHQIEAGGVNSGISPAVNYLKRVGLRMKDYI